MNRIFHKFPDTVFAKYSNLRLKFMRLKISLCIITKTNDHNQSFTAFQDLLLKVLHEIHFENDACFNLTSTCLSFE